MKNIFNKLQNTKTIRVLLLVYIGLGMFTYLDNYSEFSYSIPIWVKLFIINILFSTISFTLIYFINAAKSQSRNLKLLFAELIFWLGKYFLYKEGYISCFGGIGNPLILCYDIGALILRSLLFLSIIGKTINSLTITIASVLVILVLKITLFDRTCFSNLEFELDTKLTSENRTILIGNYNGVILNVENQKIDSIEILIDESTLKILGNPIEGLQSQYNFDLYSPKMGNMYTRKGSAFNVNLIETNNNSLIINLEVFLLPKYKLKLKRSS